MRLVRISRVRFGLMNTHFTVRIVLIMYHVKRNGTNMFFLKIQRRHFLLHIVDHNRTYAHYNVYRFL